MPTWLSRSTRLHSCGGIVAGVAAAMLVMEGALRVFATTNDPPPPEIGLDAVDLPAIVTRQIEEGLGVAHFSSAGARLTGNTPLRGAPTVVILGDSYVVAREVPDVATMGSWLERDERARGRPLNVRQYGWRGASPARYVSVASDVRSRWDPAVVLVPLSDDDLDYRAVTGSPRLQIDSAGKSAVVEEAAAIRGVPATQSVLAVLVERRWHQILARAPRFARLVTPSPEGAPLGTQTTPARRVPREFIPRAVVRQLANAFGSRLVVVYVADVRVSGGERVADSERLLLAACAAEGVTCASTRQSMLAARERGIVARGFSTTILGVGHLNAEGHRLVASEIMDLIESRLGALTIR